MSVTDSYRAPEPPPPTVPPLPPAPPGRHVVDNERTLSGQARHDGSVSVCRVTPPPPVAQGEGRGAPGSPL